jgi:hypothetical protein
LTFFSYRLILSSMGSLVQVLLVALLLTFASAARAQTSVKCGVVKIDGPSQVELGTALVLKVKTTMLHTTKPEFKWWLSAGTITTGQGTAEITVDTTGLGGLNITASVGLVGAPRDCKEAVSITFQVKMPGLIGCAFDNYGDIKFEDEQARLDNFAIQLTNEPLSSGHILISAGQETFEKEAEERLSRAKSYLADVRGIDPNRIVTVDCGFSRELTAQLWIVPVGAAPPACLDYLELPFSDVKFTKPRPKSSKKPR